jgi:hypothetical protein
LKLNKVCCKQQHQLTDFVIFIPSIIIIFVHPLEQFRTGEDGGEYIGKKAKHLTQSRTTNGTFFSIFCLERGGKS